MKKTYFLSSLFFLSIVFTSSFVRAQGCSDAGFCTLNALKSTDESMEEQHRQSIQFGFNFGAADNDVTVLSSFIDYGYLLNQSLDLHVRLGYVSQSSDLASSTGLSDIFLNANYNLNRFVFTGGLKIPIADGNRKEDGLALPMDFQPGLGTFDLILGVGYQVKQLKLTLAMQQPLSQNKNTFLPSNYPEESPFAAFSPTNNYIRKGDVLLRASYHLKLNQNWTVVPALLPIYHLGNDEYTDNTGNKMTLDGSEGLTFNGNLMINYKPAANQLFQLSLATPFVTRDLRPDGLTRSFVLGLEYIVKF